MAIKKPIIGVTLGIGGWVLPLPQATRAGDLVFLKDQIPTQGAASMTTEKIETQTRAVPGKIKATLAAAKCDLTEVVKSMVWLKDRPDFFGINEEHGEYVAIKLPTRSDMLSFFGVDNNVSAEAFPPTPGRERWIR